MVEISISSRKHLTLSSPLSQVCCRCVEDPSFHLRSNIALSQYETSTCEKLQQYNMHPMETVGLVRYTSNRMGMLRLFDSVTTTALLILQNTQCQAKSGNVIVKINYTSSINRRRDQKVTRAAVRPRLTLLLGLYVGFTTSRFTRPGEPHLLHLL